MWIFIFILSNKSVVKMSSFQINFATPSTSKDSCLNEKLNDLSPMTDLAYNMKSLKTTSVGTPSRRISWSDPFRSVTSTHCSSEYSPSADSPMLEEILMKKTKKSKSATSKNIFPQNNEDKENIQPSEELELVDMESPENDKAIEIYSQDSGYSSTSGKYDNRCFNSSGKRFSTVESTPRIKVKSSLFSNTSTKDLDDYFPMEDDVEMHPETESSMQSLFTKPLCNIESSFSLSKRKGKLPIRRCLTLEMESTGSSSTSFDLFSQDSMSSDKSNNDVMDAEPLKRLPYKRPDTSFVLPWQSKRRKSSPCVNSSDDISNMSEFLKQRSLSETAATIMQAVQQADLQPELVGDCSRCYALPLIRGRHQDLKCISVDTLVQVMKGEFRERVDSFTLVDCRYPYEFEGGHIQGAQNIYTKEDIMQTFLENVPDTTEKKIIIFHCEFSSERAPNLCRFLRNKDRELNECNYPKLHHPEIYILEGGYKAFFSSFREYCEPQDYKPMNHKDHSSELRLFRSKSKSWGADSKNRYKMKSSSDNAGS